MLRNLNCQLSICVLLALIISGCNSQSETSSDSAEKKSQTSTDKENANPPNESSPSFPGIWEAEASNAKFRYEFETDGSLTFQISSEGRSQTTPGTYTADSGTKGKLKLVLTPTEDMKIEQFQLFEFVDADHLDLQQDPDDPNFIEADETPVIHLVRVKTN